MGAAGPSPGTTRVSQAPCLYPARTGQSKSPQAFYLRNLQTIPEAQRRLAQRRSLRSLCALSATFFSLTDYAPRGRRFTGAIATNATWERHCRHTLRSLGAPSALLHQSSPVPRTHCAHNTPTMCIAPTSHLTLGAVAAGTCQRQHAERRAEASTGPGTLSHVHTVQCSSHPPHAGHRCRGHTRHLCESRRRPCRFAPLRSLTVWTGRHFTVARHHYCPQVHTDRAVPLTTLNDVELDGGNGTRP